MSESTPEAQAGDGSGVEERSSRGDGRQTTSGESSTRTKGGLLGAIREIAVIAGAALVISFLIKTFVAQAFWIPSGSMEDTLVYGDRVMVSKIQAGPLAVDRGDVIVFEDPGGWLPPVQQVDRGPVVNAMVRGLEFVGIVPSSQGGHLIKRVIGEPGDVVACCDPDGALTVNGFPLEETYLYPGDEPSTTEFEVTVPEDHVWMMGDHRSNSRDSRANDDGTGQTGSVPTENVVGQAFVLLFPFENFTWFSVPDTFADVPES